MRFTICIPTYNRAHLIGRALDSLASQTFKDFEVIVVDDGSTDNTYDIVCQHWGGVNLKYLRKDNGGKHTALNVGIEFAKGDLFLILDSDDGLFPEALQRMSEIWDACEDKQSVCGVIGKSSCHGIIIGRLFPPEKSQISYVDFHFGKEGGHYGDCCECIRTDIINRYRFPEVIESRFIPEHYITDQIGLKYKLLTTNEIFKNVFYQQGGITLSGENHKLNNLQGYLLATISKIEIIIPKAAKAEMTLRSRIRIWSQYWRFVHLDGTNKGLRVRNKYLYATPTAILGYVLFLKKCILRKG